MMTNREKTGKLTDLLREQILNNPSPEIHHEIIVATARLYQDEIIEISGREDLTPDIKENLERLKRQVENLWRSAATLRPMFGDWLAREAWLDRRQKDPFFRRLFTPKEPPAWFRREYTATQRAIGRALVEKALSDG